jgi:CheY-like chemotaxis protein
MSPSKRALVVDDNDLSSRLAAAFLRKLGWQARIADNGRAALFALDTERFDLVLLDIRMPEIGGDEVHRRIRCHMRLGALRVVAYTARGTPHETERLLASGFDSVLVKPVSFADLRAACDEIASNG